MLVANNLVEVVPSALMDVQQWVLWQYEKKDDGELTKVPYTASPGANEQHRHARSNDPTTWSDFVDAYGIATAMPDRFGVGFMLHGTPIVGTDFDGVIKDGQPEPFVLDILRLLGSPYTEVTPSGNGLRAFVECPALPAGKRRFTRSKPEKYGAEIYSGSEGGRFLTVTGNRFAGDGVPKVTDISLPYFLITQILDEKFKSLWMGDVSAYDGDESRADLALCGLIARALGKEATYERIEAAFSECQLGQRAKWNREDYRKRTIEAALKGGVPESGDFHRTELGNAKRLVAKFGESIRYNHEQKKWYEWAGSVWSRDRIAAVKVLMKSIAQSMLAEGVAMQDSKERDALIKWALHSESQSIVTHALSLAESEPGIPVLTEQFDRDSYLLNVKNGTLNLKTGEFRDHQREDLLTKIAPVAYDPAAKCPRWEQFLREVMDAETIPFLQRAVGYSLSGFTGEHCFFLLYGTGRNGKSVFLSVLQYLLGDYAMQTDWQSFAVRKNGGAEIRNDIARLHGARFIAAVESERNVRLAESLIKALTGGDRITSRFLYQEHFEFVPQFKLWLATNHKPTVIGTDEAIWSRIKLIPFDVTIPPERRDKHLTDKLRAEASGILNWALAGLQMYQRDGLQESAAVTAATSQYRANSDVLQHFLDAKCNLEMGAETRSGDLYAAFKGYADFANEFKMNERAFGQAMEERGFKRSHRSARKDKPGGVYWFGIRLNQEAQAQSDPSVIFSGAQESEELPF